MHQPERGGVEGDATLNLEPSDLILTSADFGDAYLRDGWASQYIEDRMRLGTLVLVGYAAEDAAMRPLLETLDADRDRFRDMKNLYAIERGTADSACSRPSASARLPAPGPSRPPSPSDTWPEPPPALGAAHLAAAAAAREVQVARVRLAEAEERRRQAERTLQLVCERLAQDAADLRLPESAVALLGVAAALDSYRDGLGLLRRLARQDAASGMELCRRTESVLSRLPAHGITRSQLAAEVLGDAHALDTGRPVATLVLASRRRLAASARTERKAPAEQNGDADAEQAPERARELWAAAGVLVNELARPVLFLNLPVKGIDAAGAEPCYASLRSLVRAPPRWDVSGRNVHVCENPNLVAIAADHLGSRCAPLVCTDGMPAAAQRTLLSQLTQAGARLCYHGDFDWPGLRIANHVMRAFGAQPWRFGTTDYVTAVPTAANLGQSLKGEPIEALWDIALAAAMRQHRVSIAEEAVSASLLPDLHINSRHLRKTGPRSAHA